MDNKKQETSTITQDAMIFQTAYQYNEYGYYSNPIDVQIAEGVFLPPNTTITKPDLKDGYWYVYNFSNPDGWIAKKKPTTLKEAVKLSCEFTDNSERGIYLRELFTKLTAQAENSDYYLDRYTDSQGKEVWHLKAYTEEELFTRALGNKQSELSGKYSEELNTCTVTVDLSTGDKLTLTTAQDSITTLATALTIVNCGLTFDWVDDDGNTTTLTTADDVTACIKAISAHNTAATKKWGEYKQQIEVAKTRKELEKIVIDFHGEE